MYRLVVQKPFFRFRFRTSTYTALCGGIIPLVKKWLLYNKQFPLFEKLLYIDDEDPNLAESAYDNFLAPLFEEILFALIPALLFPDSLFALVCFRAVFLFLHLIEQDHFGKFKLSRIIVHRIFTPVIVSFLAIVSMRFDIALVSHVFMNALITPVINRLFGMNFTKAVINYIHRR